MKALAIANAAKKEIGDLFARASVAKPVARFAGITRSVSIDTDTLRDIRSDRTETVVKSIEAELSKSPSGNAIYLQVFFVDESECPSGYLQLVDGVSFCIHPRFLDALQDHVLDFERDRFTLFRADGQPLASHIKQLVGDF